MEQKRTYVQPKLVNLGRVVDLTQTGKTQPGDDGKSGSAASKGG